MAGPLAEAIAKLTAAADSMTELSQRATGFAGIAQENAGIVTAVYAGVASSGGPTVAAIHGTMQKFKEASATAATAAQSLRATATALAARAQQ